MLRKFFFVISIFFGILFTLNQAHAEQINMAKSPWKAGWFQGEVIRQLLIEKGYEVPPLKAMDTGQFYQSLSEGKLDLWANGWYPSHKDFLKDDSSATPIGLLIESGALQGYLIDKKTTQKFKIKSIEDLRDPEIAKVFDLNGNGKADLAGCNLDWVCAKVIDHQLQIYGLVDTVEQISGDYNEMIEEAIQNFKKGLPILYYTWTPNWVNSRLIPDKDVSWIPVPFTSLPQHMKKLESTTVVEKLKGCVSNPCNIGFPVSNIRIVANSKFLKKHPEVKHILKNIQLSSATVIANNKKVFEGNSSEVAISSLAKQWLNNHRAMVQKWLDAKSRSNKSNQQISNQSSTLKVATLLGPFDSFYDFKGQSLEDLLEKVSPRYQINKVDSFQQLIEGLKHNKFDMALAPIPIQAELEDEVDFTHHFFQAPLGIAFSKSDGLSVNLFQNLFRFFFNGQIILFISLLLVATVLAGHLIWYLERHKKQSVFARPYSRGVQEGMWWSIMALTSVGNGSRAPITTKGRLFGSIWAGFGLMTMIYLITSIAISTFEEHPSIVSVHSLKGKSLAIEEFSPLKRYFKEQGFSFEEFSNMEDMAQALKDNKVEAILSNLPQLERFAVETNQHWSIEPMTIDFNYGFILSNQSPFLEKANQMVLHLNHHY